LGGKFDEGHRLTTRKGQSGCKRGQKWDKNSGVCRNHKGEQLPHRRQRTFTSTHRGQVTAGPQESQTGRGRNRVQQLRQYSFLIDVWLGETRTQKTTSTPQKACQLRRQSQTGSKMGSQAFHEHHSGKVTKAKKKPPKRKKTCRSDTKGRSFTFSAAGGKSRTKPINASWGKGTTSTKRAKGRGSKLQVQSRGADSGAVRKGVGRLHSHRGRQGRGMEGQRMSRKKRIVGGCNWAWVKVAGWSMTTRQRIVRK